MSALSRVHAVSVCCTLDRWTQRLRSWSQQPHRRSSAFALRDVPPAATFGLSPAEGAPFAAAGDADLEHAPLGACRRTWRQESWQSPRTALLPLCVRASRGGRRTASPVKRTFDVEGSPLEFTKHMQGAALRSRGAARSGGPHRLTLAAALSSWEPWMAQRQALGHALPLMATKKKTHSSVVWPKAVVQAAPPVREDTSVAETRDVFASVLPSVVQVETRERLVGPEGDVVYGSTQIRAHGSGWSWGQPGTIVTNAHVTEGATEIWVHVPECGRFPARLVGVEDTLMDLAVLQVDAPPHVLATLLPLQLAPSSSLSVGQTVFAVGHPNSGACKPTMGFINALQSTAMVDGKNPIMNLIAFSAKIYPGSSGGPLLNSEGQVIGICTCGNPSELLHQAISVDGFLWSLERLRTRGGLRSSWRYLVPAWLGGIASRPMRLPMLPGVPRLPAKEGGEEAVRTSVEERARTAAYKAALPSMMRLHIWRPDQATSATAGDAQIVSSGSALLWDKQGHFMANFLAVEGASKVVLILDGVDWPVEVVRTDRAADVALLQVEAPFELLADLRPANAFTAATARNVCPGGVDRQRVWAIARPYGVDGYMSEGPIISTGHAQSCYSASGGRVHLMGLMRTSNNTCNSGGGVLVLDSKTGACLGVTTMCGEGKGEVYVISWPQVQESMTKMLVDQRAAQKLPLSATLSRV